MKPLTAEQIRSAVHGRWLTNPRDVHVGGITTDTRSAQAGELYLALRGDRFDGHDFLPQAAAARCPLAIVHKDAKANPTALAAFPAGLIGVADTRKALTDLAAYHRSIANASVVAVTGSNGKTTVKRMVHHVLSQSMRGSCSPKSFNNDIGVPLTLLGVNAGDQYVVCEVGANHPGEVDDLSRLTRPHVAVITSIAPCHLEGFGSIERIAVEKASLLAGLESSGLAVVWGDSDLLDRALRAYDARVVRFGCSEGCDLRLTGYEPRGLSQRFQVNHRLWVDLPLPGQHNALNALAALAVAQRFGIAPEDAGAAMASFGGVEMRLQWSPAPGGGGVINDAYNANPGSAMAGIEVLASQPGARRVLILGDMRELGPTAPELHAQTACEAARRGVEVVIGVGEFAGPAAAGCGAACPAAFGSKEELLPRLAELLRPGDVVLLKGSRSTRMEELVAPALAALHAAAPARAGDGQGSVT